MNSLSSLTKKTKNSRTHICPLVKYLCHDPYRLTICNAPFSFSVSPTCTTDFFDNTSINICMQSLSIYPSKILFSLCFVKRYNSSSKSFLTASYNFFVPIFQYNDKSLKRKNKLVKNQTYKRDCPL